MKAVIAEFVVDHPRSYVSPPNGEHWGAFGDPEDRENGRFFLEDATGPVELLVHWNSGFIVRVSGELPEGMVEAPDPASVEHQLAVQAFYRRAFTAIDAFIERFRMRFADIQARPIRWRAARWSSNRAITRCDFTVQRPAVLEEVTWYLDGHENEALKAITLEAPKSGWGSRSISYEEADLGPLRDEVTALLKGNAAGATALDAARDTAYELILHAQELIQNERAERRRVRPSALSAALVSTASACEVYVRRLVKTKGRRMHRVIMEEKDTSFSVVDLLRIVLEDIDAIGESLNRANPELASNIRLLFDARNRSTHRGTPSVVLTYKEEVYDGDDEVGRLVEKSVVYPVTPEMVHDPDYEVDDDELGTFTLDVLALIGWLETKLGGRFANKDVEAYWHEQRGLAKNTRRERLLDDHLDR